MARSQGIVSTLVSDVIVQLVCRLRICINKGISFRQSNSDRYCRSCKLVSFLGKCDISCMVVFVSCLQSYSAYRFKQPLTVFHLAIKYLIMAPHRFYPF